jgi:hypothetical protein
MSKIHTGKQTFKGQIVQTEATIVAAATTNLATLWGNIVSVTGNTTITGFGTVDAGTVFVLTFAGTPTITYNATSLILPGAASIIAAAWDVMTVKSEWGWNWRCVSYQKASGKSVIQDTPPAVFWTATFASNAYVVTTSPVVPPVNGMVLRFIAPSDTWGIPQFINLNWLWNVLFHYLNPALNTQTILRSWTYKAGDMVEAIYNGTTWNTLNKFSFETDNGWTISSRNAPTMNVVGTEWANWIWGISGTINSSSSGAWVVHSPVRFYIFSDSNKYFRLKFYLVCSNIGSYDVWFWLSTDTGAVPNDIYEAETNFASHQARFLYKASWAYYCCTSNWSAQTNTSFTPSWSAEFEIIKIGTSIYFLQWGILRATHTTNLPSSWAPSFVIWTSNQASSASTTIWPILWAVQW